MSAPAEPRQPAAALPAAASRKHPPVTFAVGWNACINCGACVAVCPQPAGFVSAFDTIAVGEVCEIACMACEDICPVFTITHQLAAPRPTAP